MPKKLIVIVSLLFVVMFALSACAQPTAAPVEEPEATAAPTEAAVV